MRCQCLNVYICFSINYSQLVKDDNDSSSDSDDSINSYTNVDDIDRAPHEYFGYEDSLIERSTTVNLDLQTNDLVVYFDNCIHLDDFNSSAGNADIYGISSGILVDTYTDNSFNHGDDDDTIDRMIVIVSTDGFIDHSPNWLVKLYRMNGNGQW